ncbi:MULTISPECIES: hypothetical protein [Glutamicibacter]|uniref:Type II toxin-antitoxin system RelE/ParE family toxin n=2 Tax=Glutamicibacter arilaitensis TaxID=256701 RepID=A0A2N7S5R2_9MICC|nr:MULTISPECIES: hypothetical protein [Glutamicibacter]PMQ21478.1 hypothetical protein CIK84_08015 [Glutamicibacter arilaitensis]CBT75317.1 conserved hypothetical protein [Glutamicibacter arilaitensis Re117]HCH46445.1 hypothetical protein [Glutamicibacter sp.]HCJ54425.1 hypothetical protein [Glutamicibacter sp.]
MPSFELLFTEEASSQLDELESRADMAVKLKKVYKALGFLENDPKYPGLNSHKYSSLSGISGEDVWDSYVENRTPAAWRIFWHYGPKSGEITVLMITPHP